jgi:hypothetical protein
MWVAIETLCETAWEILLINDTLKGYLLVVSGVELRCQHLQMFSFQNLAIFFAIVCLIFLCDFSSNVFELVKQHANCMN